MGWFGRVFGLGRGETEDTSVEAMRARAASAAPPPEPVVSARPEGGPFRMPVQDVFAITGRGTVVTGLVETGTATVGQQVRVVRAGAVVATTTVTAIEKFRAQLETAQPGENVGLLLADLTRQQVQSGDVVEG